MNICLDFDGVLHDVRTVPPGARLGRPVEGAMQACWDLHYAGHLLYVHTARQHNTTDTAWLEKWLRYWDFPYMRIEVLKPHCDLYLDDHGWRFTTWEAFKLCVTIPMIDDVLPEVPQWTR